MAGNEEKMTALLNDLHELSNYLHGRGEKSRLLSQQFAENAKKDTSNRDFDLNQARMLDYQHHIWHEIGSLVEKLIKQYE